MSGLAFLGWDVSLLDCATGHDIETRRLGIHFPQMSVSTVAMRQPNCHMQSVFFICVVSPSAVEPGQIYGPSRARKKDSNQRAEIVRVVPSISRSLGVYD